MLVCWKCTKIDKICPGVITGIITEGEALEALEAEVALVVGGCEVAGVVEGGLMAIMGAGDTTDQGLEATVMVVGEAVVATSP